jgi:hypothetical protein
MFPALSKNQYAHLPLPSARTSLDAVGIDLSWQAAVDRRPVALSPGPHAAARRAVFWRNAEAASGW